MSFRFIALMLRECMFTVEFLCIFDDSIDELITLMQQHEIIIEIKKVE